MLWSAPHDSAACCWLLNTGGEVIDTSKVTTSPYEIHYTAVDALGNIAVPVSRSVTVYNPCLPEAYCTASGELPCLLNQMLAVLVSACLPSLQVLQVL